MGISGIIKDLCENKDSSFAKLERDLGFGNGTIRNWDKNSPSVDKLQKVANYFKVSTDYLLGRGNIYDLGWAIKEEREFQCLSEKELGEIVGISEFELLQYESDDMPISKALAEKISNAFGMSRPALLVKYELYDEQIPTQFDGDVDAYEDFKKAVDEDVLSESNQNNIFDDDLSEDEQRAVRAFLEAYRKQFKTKTELK